MPTQSALLSIRHHRERANKAESELATLREQVRVLREACESARRLIPFGITYQQLTDALKATKETT